MSSSRPTMEDDYQRRLSQAHRMFSTNEVKGGMGLTQERRGENRRGTLDRRTLMDRRQQEVVVEHERRKSADRRSEANERRSMSERRVTSNWSEERYQEEVKKLKRKQDYLRRQFWFIVIWLVCLSTLLWLLAGCSTKVSCGYETVNFLGMKFHSPIPQKCADRPNRKTDIVGW